MVFWPKSKKRISKGLLAMDPMPVIKRDNAPSTSQATASAEKRFQKGDANGVDRSQLDDDLRCPVCSEFFIEAHTLNCSHTFCKYCIDRWRETNLECPICRAEITCQIHTLALDQVIEKLLKNRPSDLQGQRKAIIKEREKESSAREQMAQRPVQAYTCSIHNNMGGINIWGSILDVINGTDDDDLDDADAGWISYDHGGSSTDEYEEYCVYTGPNYY
ncbi:unnamed protein product [Phyllotreta striolata]|uniref:RING-type domain-containing protein n=1 Tax=Phyllotreta striolata TaxID=444603 RepID=A0A9N9TIM2_PHYSR|nr:unnamed protein product [Phyllotreta striolata]